MKRKLSILMPLVLVISVAGVSVLKNMEAGFRPVDFLLILLYVSWIALESSVAVKDFSSDYISTDRMTREFYAVSQFATVISSIYFWDAESGIYLLKITGGVLITAGVILRLYSIRCLGIYYSHNVRLLQSHQTVTTGPYSVIRHPSYAGMIIIHGGVVTGFFSYIALGVFLILLIPSVLIRIKIEETVLVKLEGYKDYSIGKKRLIPFIW